MSTRLLTERDVWPTITDAAKRSKTAASVAVAYFGQGAGAMLPLPSGSRLVVDASESAVKSGQTCPAELKKMMRQGIRIYTVQNLHAKVFVIGRTAIIGSANVSRNSARNLVEAVIKTTEATAVASAREFVRGLCLQPIGLEMLKRLADIYKPPRVPDGGTRKKGVTRNSGRLALDPVRIEHLYDRDLPEGSREAQEAGEKVAIEQMEKPGINKLERFTFIGKCPIGIGNRIIQISDEGWGKKLVSPPGVVVHLKPWKEGRENTTIVYLERADQRRISLTNLIKRLGPGSKVRLDREGRVSREFAGQLLEVWNR
ncbi:MAG TPA: phospholipase D family protein [Candidatus Deferrimicrobiaceae bacterium]|jgi:hypothetical protein